MQVLPRSFFWGSIKNVRTAIPILLTAAERKALHCLVETPGQNRRLAQRARIVLLAAEGLQNDEIAAEMGTDPHTVARWRSRFALHRLAGIQKEAPRSGRKRRARQRTAAEILRVMRLCQKRGRPWSTRSLARMLGINHMLVYRVLKDHGIKVE